MTASLGSASTTSTAANANPAAGWVDAPRAARRGRLLHKLLVIFLLLSLGPLFLAGLQLIHVGDDYIQKEIVGVKLGIAQKVASNVTSYIDDKKNTLQIVHKSSDFLTMKTAGQTEILSNVMNAYPVFMRMTVLDLNGREVTTVNRMGSSQGHRVEEQKALRSIRRSLGDYVSPVSRSPEGYPQLTLGVPIERIPGRPVGVLLGVINLIDLSSLVKDLQIDQKDYEKGYVYIVDMRGHRLVAHPHIETLLSNDPPPEVQAAALAPEETDTGAMEFADQHHNRFLAAYATVPGLNWRVFFQQPVAEAYRASRQMRQKIVLVMIAVALLTVILGVGVSHLIVGRVQTLQEAMEQVGEGNFDIPEVPRSNDEFGALTEKFLQMARSLKDKTLKLLSAQRELQRWNSDLEKRVQERTRDLKEAQDQLIAQEKLAALGQMASVVGHELRNPLAVMNNSIYYLKTKLQAALSETSELDPKVEKHIKIIESEIVKSNAIIRDVLDFSRNRALNAAPYRMDELVEKALERIQMPQEIALSKELTLGAIETLVDEDEIRQVLVNLMENACQAMTKGGTLSVGTKAHKEMVEVTIGDSGCGIPQEHLSKIFAPFFTTKSRGTGLGLAVVKKIIERHQGTIEVRSKVGEGTQFRILLPLKGVPQTAPIGGSHVG
jgi:signal transduction histidine kinase